MIKMEIEEKKIKMLIEVKEPQGIKDGAHEGKIISVQFRTEPYEYTDFVIEFDGKTIKAGFPTNISSVSKLGKMLKMFGVKLQVGDKINPEVLVGKQVTFMTLNDGNYAN